MRPSSIAYSTLYLTVFLMRQVLDVRLSHTLTYSSFRQSSISNSKDIVVYNRKNGRIKQDETEMGVDGLLGNLQWLPLHYKGLGAGLASKACLPGTVAHCR